MTPIDESTSDESPYHEFWHTFVSYSLMKRNYLSNEQIISRPNAQMITCSLLFIGLLMLTMSAQAQVRLNNPSFEAPPKDATVPPGWEGCGMYSTPDIMPGNNEYGQPIWDVTHRPVDGATYIGLITREDNTREYIGQRLNKPLKSRHCYMFSVDLASSPFYAGYNTPIRLRVWLSNEQCEKTELIAETPTVKHYDWKKYQFVFSVNKSYSHIIFEAVYAEGIEQPYRGNLLMDNISLITDCDRA